jgi:hypothetical protein
VLYLVAGLMIGLFLNMQFESTNVPAASATPARVWQMIVIPATSDQVAFQQWLARRGAESRVAEIVLAAELNEADVEAVAEREDVIAVRDPQPGEVLPAQMRGWLPLIVGGAP